MFSTIGCKLSVILGCRLHICPWREAVTKKAHFATFAVSWVDNLFKQETEPCSSCISVLSGLDASNGVNLTLNRERGAAFINSFMKSVVNADWFLSEIPRSVHEIHILADSIILRANKRSDNRRFDIFAEDAFDVRARKARSRRVFKPQNR